MANKFVKYSFMGANQDVSKSKHPPQYYFEAGHIRILSTNSQSSGSVSNEKGNELIITIPDIFLNTVLNRLEYNDIYLPYENPELISQLFGEEPIGDLYITGNEIIGHTATRDGMVLFTTNLQGIDAIWYLKNVIEGNYQLELLYLRKLDFSKEYPIQAIFNYENIDVQKVYWVDGVNQIRFINITNDNRPDNQRLIDIPYTTINFVGEISFTQPEIIDISGGGTHTAGMIQYAYNLFRLNGSQTKLSPLSRLIPLGKGFGLGGGEINEVVGTSPVIKITGLDPRYTNIRVYAIKYTSYNEAPSISLIDEREISLDGTVTILDDGFVIDTFTLEQLLFLGSDPIVPKHIESKDNRLFPANIKTKNFLLPDELDCRAYGFKQNTNEAVVVDTVTSVPISSQNPTQGEVIGTRRISVNDTFDNIPLKHASINVNYDSYKYRKNSISLGGDGKYLYYKIYHKTEQDLLPKKAIDLKFFKDNELYRIGIQFYNNLGQTSLPQWIADFKSLSGNLKGMYTALIVEFKQELIDLIQIYNNNNVNGITGFKIIRADRQQKDRTILYQGAITTMIFQLKSNAIINQYRDGIPDQAAAKNHADISLKVPTYITRTFNNFPEDPEPWNTTPGEDGGELMGANHLESLTALEIYKAGKPKNKLQWTWQFDKMMQLYSPELIFDDYTNVTSGLEVSVKGMVNVTETHSWIEERNVDTHQEKNGGKMQRTINWAERIDDTDILVDNNIVAAQSTPRNSGSAGFYSFINPTGADDTANFRMYHRRFNLFTAARVIKKYNVYGNVEYAERGQGPKAYNDDDKYKYTNSLQSIISDAGFKDNVKGIASINSYGARNVTFMLGNDPLIPTSSRKGSVELMNESKVLVDYNCNGDGILLVEMSRPIAMLYMGNLYGGNQYEDKKRTVYIEIGDYVSIEDNNYISIINDPGDTFVQRFKLMRIGRGGEEIYNPNTMQITDIIEFPVETSIDLKNRNDRSFGDWQTIFQPYYDQYHKYNKVYSQQPSLIRNQDVDYKFRRVDSFDTRIQTTKLKIPNESIDSWTDILVNEVMDLNGKYGAINGLVSFNDELYTFQDESIAKLQISPRVQVQADDNIGIELGTGNVLYNYNYLTTKSGSINKWGIAVGKKGIYYYDALNKGIGRVPDSTGFLLSDAKGMHTFYNNNFIYDQLKIDNPLLGTGALLAADIHNNDIYFTLLQNNTLSRPIPINNESELNKPTVPLANIIKPSTWCYNEIFDTFIDLKRGYSNPSMYLSKSDTLLLSKDNIKLYEQGAGDYNKFFDEYYPSYVTLMLNPESDIECIFDNIHYNSEVYLNNIDQPEKTLTHIRAYNEYQDSGKIPLIVGRDKNIRRKFREWQANIPREGRDRIRNTWIYLHLEFDNESNYKMILHDITVMYTV